MMLQDKSCSGRAVPHGFLRGFALLTCLLCLLSILLLLPGKSFAAIYECKTSQVVWWHDGKIEPYIESPGHRAGKNALIRFDTKSGLMDWQFDRDSRVITTKFDVIRNAQYDDVVAVHRDDDAAIAFASVLVFQIYADQKPGTSSFMFYGTADGKQISAGRCHADDKMDGRYASPVPDH